MRRHRRLVLHILLVVAFIALAWWWYHPHHLRLNHLTSCPDVNPKDAYALRVLFVTNPRFPQLSSAQRSAILRNVPVIAKRLLDVKVLCFDTGEISTKDFFRRYDKSPVQMSLTDQLLSSSQMHAIDASIDATLARAGSQGRDQYLADFFQPRSRGESLYRYAHALFWQRHVQLYSITAEDGRPLLKYGDPRFDSLVEWERVLHNVAEADVIFTSDLLRSVELEGRMALHGILRGGIGLGSCQKSRATHSGTAVVSLYPILSRTQQFAIWRGGDLTLDEQIVAATYVAVHELGHLLRNLDDEFAHENCVMRPVVGLRFTEWIQGIQQAGLCRYLHHYRRDALCVPKPISSR